MAISQAASATRAVFRSKPFAASIATAFAQLIRSAVADRMKELSAEGSRIQPLGRGEFAIVWSQLDRWHGSAARG